MTIPDPIVVAGIDAGKSKLDAHILKGGLERRFNNDKCGRRALCNWLLKHGVTRTVFEPTGRYHRNLHQCLFDAAIETVLVNPLCSRRFAEALGQLAKNDRVDAAMLARFGCLEGLEPTPPQPRQAVQGRPRRRHAQTRQPAQHPAPGESPVAGRTSHPPVGSRRMSPPNRSHPRKAVLAGATCLNRPGV